ncbi:MAG: LysR family transcriptional regulator, partial [Ferrovibrionaceae bacterium]
MNNRAGEMDVFVQAVRSGSFSAAGRRLGLSPSAVSKVVSRIEDRLGTRLLVRSTRSLKLTAEGEAYHGRALRILADIEETERMVA